VLMRDAGFFMSKRPPSSRDVQPPAGLRPPTVKSDGFGQKRSATFGKNSFTWWHPDIFKYRFESAEGGE
jgi:hypothetical protein